MVSGKLDLSPVIHLLNALSAGDREPTPQTQLQKISLSRSRPTLGDFTPLWNYIGHEPITRTVTPINPLRLPAPPLPPPPDSPALEPVTAVKKTPKSKIPKLTTKKSTERVTAAFYVQQFPPTTNTLRTTVSDPNLKQSRLVSALPGKKNKNVAVIKTPVKAPVQPVNWNERVTITPNEPFHVRKTNLIKKLLVNFPADANTIVPSLSAAKDFMKRELSQNGVHIFIDNSNIVVGFLDAIKMARGHNRNQRINKPPFSFHNLSLILERGRSTARRILVGSKSSNADDVIIEEARALKYDCSILKRVEDSAPPPRRRSSRKNINADGFSSGSDSPGKVARTRWREQGVDEILNLKMMESIIDYHIEPSTLVLASGDGAVGEFSDGFFKVVVRALERGWKVELVSFALGMSSSYTNREFTKRWCNQFKIICLDNYIEELLG